MFNKLLFTLLLIILPVILNAENKYEIISLGNGNSEKRQIPDLSSPDKYFILKKEQIIDIILLADGYCEKDRERFDRDITNWYNRFISLSPFRELQHCFRVRSIWTPGSTWAGTEGKSYFHTGVSADNTITEQIRPEMASSIFNIISKFDFNREVFPGTRKLSNTYLVMLVKSNDGGGTPGGRPLLITSPDKKFTIMASLGEDSMHEFGHSFAYLGDEYIETAGSGSAPQFYLAPSMIDEEFNMGVRNISFSPVITSLPWKHLAPGSLLNPDKQSLIGRLWIGGTKEYGVWHSESHCLMNGGHENWNLEKTKRGAWLRDTGRFCFWCEELTASRIYYLTGQLGNLQNGVEIWKQWENLRPLYYSRFNVTGRIEQQNKNNSANGLPGSKLYHSPLKMIPVESKYSRGVVIKNSSSKKILFESDGKVLCGSADNKGFIWIIEGDINGFIRIKNAESGHYINIENNFVESSDIRQGAWSSQWILFQENEKCLSINNRWKPERISAGTGKDVLSVTADPSFTGNNLWIMEDAGIK